MAIGFFRRHLAQSDSETWDKESVGQGEKENKEILKESEMVRARERVRHSERESYLQREGQTTARVRERQ